jgi:hypothetical protein
MGIQDIIDATSIQNFIAQTTPEVMNALGDMTIKDLIITVILNPANAGSLFSNFIGLGISALQANFHIMVTGLIMVLALSILDSLTPDDTNATIAKPLILLAITLPALLIARSLAIQAISTATGVVGASIPLIATLQALTGNLVLSGWTVAVTASVPWITWAFANVLIPVIIFNTVFKITGQFANQPGINTASKHIDKGIRYLQRFGFWASVTVLGIAVKSLVLPNKLISGTAKSLIGAIPVVGSVIQGGTSTLLNVAEVALTGTGVALVAVTILSVVLPVVSLLANTILLYVSSFLGSIISGESKSATVEALAAGSGQLYSATITCINMIIVAIMAFTLAP